MTGAKLGSFTSLHQPQVTSLFDKRWVRDSILGVKRDRIPMHERATFSPFVESVSEITKFLSFKFEMKWNNKETKITCT